MRPSTIPRGERERLNLADGGVRLGSGEANARIGFDPAIDLLLARWRESISASAVNRLEEESRVGKARTLAARLSRLDVVVLDKLGYQPFARFAANSCSTSSASFTRAPR